MNATTQLLSSFLCEPIAMKPDRLALFVPSLVARLKSTAPQPMPQGYGLAPTGPVAVMPWDAPIYVVEGDTAFVMVKGPLVKGYDNFTTWYYELASIDRLQQAVSEIQLLDAVAKVVFVIDSPGGQSAGMPELADAIVALGATKLTVGFTGDTMASNAYRIGAACRLVFATRSACVGCVGTYIAFYDYSAYLAQEGIKLELFRDGDLKGLGIPGNPVDEKARAFFTGIVARSGGQFKDLVRARRPGIEESTMQGQWFDGEQAVDLKLVDRVVTGLAEVVAELQAE